MNGCGDYDTEVAIERLHDHYAYRGTPLVDKEALHAFLWYICPSNPKIGRGNRNMK